MATRFGISGIIEKTTKDSRVIVRTRSKDHRIPLWVGNITFNFKKEAKELLTERVSVHDYLQRGYKAGTIVVVPSLGFVSNGVAVLFKDLYPGSEDYFVCMAKYGYNLMLLTLGSKTVQEFRQAGHDSFLKSRVPLTLTIEEKNGKKEFVAINMQPAIREDEVYVRRHQPKPKEASDGKAE